MEREWNVQGHRVRAVRRRAGRRRGRARRRRPTPALADFPTAETQTIDTFKKNQLKQVNQLLGLIFALLSLSVIVALLGHHQHARAVGARAHARARPAARGRHVAAARCGGWCAAESVITAGDRRAARASCSASRSRCWSRARWPTRASCSSLPVGHADRRRDPGRDRGRAGGDPARPAGGEGRRAAGCDDRVAGSVLRNAACGDGGPVVEERRRLLPRRRDLPRLGRRRRRRLRRAADARSTTSPASA